MRQSAKFFTQICVMIFANRGELVVHPCNFTPGAIFWPDEPSELHLANDRQNHSHKFV